MLCLGETLSSNPYEIYSSLYLRLLGLRGGSHSWMQQDCLSADHSSACLGGLGGSEPWSSGSYHPCLALGLDPATSDPVPDLNLACVD